MLLMLLVDLFFVGAGVYMFLNGQIAPGVAMVVMGAVATAILAMRRAASARQARESGPRGSFTGATTGLTLEPELEAEVRALAKTQRIAAVKRVRDATGASLKAAVAYVDRLRRCPRRVLGLTAAPAASPPTSPRSASHGSWPPAEPAPATAGSRGSRPARRRAAASGRGG